MTNRDRQPPVDQPTFWSEEGGQRWVKNIETVERQIRDLGRILLKRAAPKPGEIVLDVGCGGGITSKELADRVGPSGRVLGVDVSEVILDLARQRFSGVSNLSFEHGDAQQLELPPGAFDLIISRFGVMFFEDPIAAFSNLRSALKDNGRLVFMCWRTPQENPWMSVPATAVLEVLGSPPPPDPDAPGPFAFGNRDHVRRILEQSGFTAIGFEPIDENVDLGTIDEAIRLVSELGPAAAPLREATEAERKQAIEAVSEVLKKHETPDGVRLPSGTWIISATV